MAHDSYTANHDGLERRETSDLISSRKVEGTAVYDRSGEKLGTIESFMVNKQTGQVKYAALEFGGLFGLGSDYYPIPWNQLEYSSVNGGYSVDLDRSVLEKAPRYSGSDEPRFDDAYGDQINEYYDTYRPI
jgi:sporulation protein YlmC with PRC-barrel domain